MDGIRSGKKILDVVSDRIISITSGRTVLVAFAGILVTGFLVNGRPFGIAELKSITGGVGILDMEVFYTPEQAYAFLAAMGEAGRSFELTRIIPLDHLVPLFYALFLSTLITWILHRWLPAESGWHRLNVVPVIGALFDYLENLGIIAMLLAYPMEMYSVAQITMAATLLKFGFSVLAGIILLVAFAGWMVTALRKISDAFGVSHAK
ncbi:hypothetical protein [Methanoregula sp.]|uniref:hypothetical protein n=1 Tax=Methanoregula sp. TaxID=2052170 RepID=UPI002622E248|nr:hypothetical protein [Methanoregula sp.]MDD5142052.1 hypothetical protein [Methanoregula sp.]